MIGKAILNSIVTLATVGSAAAIAADVPSANPAKGKTRQEVKAELAAWMKNPITIDGYRFIGGEVGFAYEGPQAAASALGSGTGAALGGLTRAQVRQELVEFQKNPVSADGQWRYTGGEQGWVRLGPAYERRNGTWVRAR